MVASLGGWVSVVAGDCSPGSPRSDPERNELNLRVQLGPRVTQLDY